MATINTFGTPTVLPNTAEEQRRQISDYQSSVGANAVTGQGFVNETNTNILAAIQNNNKANDDNSQTANFGSTSADASSTTPQQDAIKQGNLKSDGTIEPQPNILDSYSSYTYTASVYLMSTLQYTRLLRSKKKSINGYNLLFQSGGAPANVGGPLPAGQTSELGVGDTQADYGRNPSFPQDFYIDSITIDNALPGQQTQAAHMVTSMKFTVIEPANITLLDRLYAAVQNMGQTVAETNQPINYTAAAYLMVLRWYGYDANGKLVAGRTALTDGATLSDPNSICEKFIPFIIKKIDWSVTSKLVTYEFDCAPINQMISNGTRRGTIPYDVQLTSTTVGELLGGDTVYSTNTASSSDPGAHTTSTTKNSAATVNSKSAGGLSSARLFNAQNQQRVPLSTTQTQTPVGIREEAIAAANNQSAAPSKANAATDRKIIKLGLMGAMNEYQQQLVLDNIYKKADSYEIVFVPGRDGKHNIKDAVLKKASGSLDKKESNKVKHDNTGMAPGTSANANQALNPATSAMNISSRNFSITAGMQVVQAIDLAIRNSSYITDQSLVSYNEFGLAAENTERTQPMRWFKINMEAEQSEYDRFRNDYTYKIKFIVSEYEVPNFDSKYFPLSKFRGVHKSYPYWFTGQNSAVLDYTANFNGLYNITVTGTTPDNSVAAKQRELFTSSMLHIPKYTYAPSSTESRSGANFQANEVAANAAEYLYSPGSLGKARIRIIGDPAWIQQGDLAGSVDAENFSYAPFLPDGTINFDSNQVLFEIAWQRPQDYSLATGLSNPFDSSTNEARKPIQSNVYHAWKVTSEFRQGKFEQTIEGALYMFPIPSGKNSATGQPVTPDQSAAETERLKRQAVLRPTTAADAPNRVGSRSGITTTGNQSDQLRVASLRNAATDRVTSLLPTGTRVAADLARNNNAVLNQQNATVAASLPTLSTLLPSVPPVSNGTISSPAQTIAPRPLRIDLQSQALFRNNPQQGAKDY